MVSAVDRWISINIFPSLVGAPVSISTSVVGVKICAITTGIKKIHTQKKQEDSQEGSLD